MRCLIRPTPIVECILEPFTSPVEVVEMKLPEARPLGIVPMDRPWQLALLVQEAEADDLQAGSLRRQRKVTIAGCRRVNGAPYGVMAMGSGPGQRDPGRQSTVDPLP